jgi:ParB-like chromosome segregation protein Spo0J
MKEHTMVPLGQLVDHGAQMRTRMDPDELARLTLQVYERGLDDHQPIIAVRAEDGTYAIISGHRRRTATLLAEEVRERAAENGGRVVDLDFVQQVLVDLAGQPGLVTVCAHCGTPLVETVQDGYHGEDWCPHCENWVGPTSDERMVVSPETLVNLHPALLEKHGHVEVPVAIFAGSEKEQILTLQAANFGQEEPDLLGQARSYEAARKAGATPAEIAANTGQSADRVRAVLALANAPEPLQQAILDGTLALGVAKQIARLKKAPQRRAVSRYILDGCRCPTVGEVKTLVSELLDWQPPEVPLDPDLNPQARNGARLLGALWTGAMKEDPEHAWYVIAEAVHRGRIRLADLAGDDDLDARLADLVPGADCEHCQLREAMQEASALFPRYLSHPCQTGEGANACMQGVFAGDPFWVQVPWGWEDYPGVCRRTGGAIGCSSVEDFREAIAAAAAGREAEENETDADDGGPGGPDGRYTPPPQAATPQDVAGQRELIRSFIEHHLDLSGARHPLATRCEDCRYRLDGSPTKDPSVPPCQWAAKRRGVQFWIRVPADDGGEGPQVPLCRQYAPTRTWKEIVQEHPAPPGVPREWMMHLIELQVRDIQGKAGYGSEARQACEILTGRPLKASDSHRGWFMEGLKEQAGNLSTGQLWTLLMWVSVDWMYHHHYRYLLPMPDGRTLLYNERSWKTSDFGAEPEEPQEEAEGAKAD